jgi:hypothetical protein
VTDDTTELAAESRPGDGYAPDPPAQFMCRYLCPCCGARFESMVAVDRLARCRNDACDGQPERHRGSW